MFSTSAPVISWIGFRVIDVYGTRIGRAVAYVADSANYDEDWIVVRCGRLTSRSHKLAPFADAIVSSNEIWLPLEISAVLASPSAEAAPPYAGGALLEDIFRHYLAPHDRTRVKTDAPNAPRLARAEPLFMRSGTFGR